MPPTPPAFSSLTFLPVVYSSSSSTLLGTYLCFGAFFCSILNMTLLIVAGDIITQSNALLTIVYCISNFRVGILKNNLNCLQRQIWQRHFGDGDEKKRNKIREECSLGQAHMVPKIRAIVCNLLERRRGEREKQWPSSAQLSSGKLATNQHPHCKIMAKNCKPATHAQKIAFCDYFFSLSFLQ